MSFPDNFIWGAASCAYQIEGAYNEDGKGPSIWDALSDGHVVHGNSGKTACDHYHHFRIASYMYAYYAAEAEDVRVREDMEKYLKPRRFLMR